MQTFWRTVVFFMGILQYVSCGFREGASKLEKQTYESLAVLVRAQKFQDLSRQLLDDLSNTHPCGAKLREILQKRDLSLGVAKLIEKSLPQIPEAISDSLNPEAISEEDLTLFRQRSRQSDMKEGIHKVIDGTWDPTNLPSIPDQISLVPEESLSPIKDQVIKYVLIDEVLRKLGSSTQRVLHHRDDCETGKFLSSLVQIRGGFEYKIVEEFVTENFAFLTSGADINYQDMAAFLELESKFKLWELGRERHCGCTE